MNEFRGSFKEITSPDSLGRLLVAGSYLLPAPNRYRKMIEHAECKTSWGEGNFDNDAIIARQSTEFEWPNPQGLEFDLFDCYLSWGKA